jgi:flagellar protein FlbD
MVPNAVIAPVVFRRNGSMIRRWGSPFGREGRRQVFRRLVKTSKDRKTNMIPVTRLNGKEFFINPDLIQTMEATPNTVITFTNDQIIVVKESPQVIVDRIIVFRSRVRNYLDPDNTEE